MSWKSIAVPLVVIFAGMAIIVLMLTAPDRSSTVGAGGRSVAFQDEPPCSSYPTEDQPSRCRNSSAYPDQTTATTTSPTQGTATATVTGTTTTTTTAITPQATSPTVATTSPTAPTAQTASSPEDTSTPEANGRDVTTPEATPGSALTCAPGEPVLITGQGPPRAAFLLYFGQRVVGGGSVSLNGRFSIPLVVGHERPGSYPVTVRVRGSEEVLRELTCEVPPAAPATPTNS